MVDLCRSVEAAMSDALQAVLSQLDQWRHLPKYRLEQHVDVLFGMTLPKVLSSRFGIPVDDLQVIPEFPIRYGTLASRHQGKATNDQSFNVDFSVWSKSRERVFLVELKTDAGSLDVKQLCKMVEVKEHGGGFGDFVVGVIQISRVTSDRRKYAQLIWRLHEVGAVSVPPRFRELQMEDDRPGLVSCHASGRSLSARWSSIAKRFQRVADGRRQAGSRWRYRRVSMLLPDRDLQGSQGEVGSR